ncbi:thioredoxin domain-containing protein, partial [Actinotignum timonense]
MADMSMRGPVDLAALAAAKKQENAAPVPGAYLTTLTAAGLNAEVQLSAQVPVIVLFVADGAAGELGTTLEAEARRRDGQIRIAVVNASTEAEL